MINLKEMNLTELMELKAQVEKRISELQKTQTQLVVYTHDCKDGSNHHLNKNKHWAKVLTAVDTTKTNGYAFIGEWLKVTVEHKLAVGSIVVEVCGSTIKAYRIIETGKALIEESNTSAMSGLIENLAKLF